MNVHNVLCLCYLLFYLGWSIRSLQGMGLNRDRGLPGLGTDRSQDKMAEQYPHNLNVIFILFPHIIPFE